MLGCLPSKQHSGSADLASLILAPSISVVVVESIPRFVQVPCPSTGCHKQILYVHWHLADIRFVHQVRHAKQYLGGLSNHRCYGVLGISCRT